MRNLPRSALSIEFHPKKKKKKCSWQTVASLTHWPNWFDSTRNSLKNNMSGQLTWCTARCTLQAFTAGCGRFWTCKRKGEEEKRRRRRRRSGRGETRWKSLRYMMKTPLFHFSHTHKRPDPSTLAEEKLRLKDCAVINTFFGPFLPFHEHCLGDIFPQSCNSAVSQRAIPALRPFSVFCFFLSSAALVQRQCFLD